MRTIGTMLLLGILSACSHTARKVDCEGHLEAINPPAAAKPTLVANP